MTKSYKISLLVLLACLAVSCGNENPATPVETLKAYTIAVKKQDTKMMKLLLSEASIKLHQEQAKAQGVSVDEIIQQETLFPATQRVFDYRNEKIEGNSATVEVKNDIGNWDTVFLVREGGIWKIDKKRFSDQIIDQNEDAERKLDDEFEKDRQEPIDGEDTEVTPTPENPEEIPSPTLVPDETPPVDGATPTPGEIPNDAGDPPKNDAAGE